MQTIKAQAQAHNIKYNTVMSRLGRGLSLQEALTKPVQHHDMTIRCRVELMGLNPHTIAARLHKGMSMDDAFKPSRPYRPMDLELVKKLAADGHRSTGIAHILERDHGFICTYLKKHKIEYKRG